MRVFLLNFLEAGGILLNFVIIEISHSKGVQHKITAVVLIKGVVRVLIGTLLSLFP